MQTWIYHCCAISINPVNSCRCFLMLNINILCLCEPTSLYRWETILRLKLSSGFHFLISCFKSNQCKYLILMKYLLNNGKGTPCFQSYSYVNFLFIFVHIYLAVLCFHLFIYLSQILCFIFQCLNPHIRNSQMCGYRVLKLLQPFIYTSKFCFGTYFQ